MSCTTNTCGVGGWSGPLPGDPSNNSVLTATPAFGGIDVTWTYPSTNPQALSYTKLYRGLSADFNSAILLQELGGGFFYDKLSTSTRYYYWIQFVSVNATVGELIGPATAVAKPTIEAMIELLTGQIDSGLLATSLRTELDQISTLNSNLANEVFDREGGDTTLAEAMVAVNLGLAEAHTFILDEINTRTDQNSAMVEAIEGIVATSGAGIASVVTSMAVSVDSDTGLSTAMYMAKVNANGLLGGFGLLSNGSTVEAGFDVDRFWIGRTSGDKRKPFIIDGGVVYIDEAVIKTLTFTKIRDESGSFIVESGKVKADYLNIRGLSVQAPDGTVLLSVGVPLPEAYTTQAQFQAERVWNFSASSADGWVNVNASTLTPGASSLAVVSTGSDPGMRSPTFSIYGPANTKVRARLRRTGGTTWAGELYYTTGAHGDSTGYYKNISGPVGSGWQVLEWDMSSLTAGGTDWVSSSITNIRMDLGLAAGDNFEVDWIAIGSTSPGSYGAPSGSSVGTSTADAVSAATAAVNDGTTGLAQRLQANARNLLTGAGGLATGSLTWDSSGVRTPGTYGVGITQQGIVAFNSSGVATFTLDGSTGAATYAGALVAASGTFAGTLTAAAVDAVSTVNIAGNSISVPISATATNWGVVSVSVVIAAGDIPSGQTTRPVTIIGSQDVVSNTYFDIGVNPASYTVAGDLLAALPPFGGVFAMAFVVDLPVGTHTIACWNHGTGNADDTANTRKRSIVAFLSKR